MSQAETKRWGSEEFWGLSFDYDPQWIFDEEQKAIQMQLMEVCRTVIRPQAIVSDEKYEFPRKSIDALASLRLMGLIVPKELGGRGQNHLCVAMVAETIARYGCSSTAMIYVMHCCAVANLLLHHHDNKHFQDLLRRLDDDKLLGTLVLSDPATGGHTWYSMSSKTKLLEDGRYQLLKYCSWTTSAGFADFYAVEVTSPNFDGNYMNESVFLMYKDEVRSRSNEWSACGMRGNHSAPLICEAVLSPDRLIGPIGDFPYSGLEVVNPYFLLLTSACWNGIAMGCIDIARNHVINKKHFDRGMRVGDYPIVQDYIGNAISDTNACRMLLYSTAQGLDQVTDNSDWDIYLDKSSPVMRRMLLAHWCSQVKIKAAANVNQVSDAMMNACGGAGYKSELGLERLMRDGRAGCVMGMSNEILRQIVGQSALYGLQSIDLWGQQVDTKRLNSQMRKLSVDEKLTFADQLLREVQTDITDDNSHDTVDENNNYKVKFNNLNQLYDRVKYNNDKNVNKSCNNYGVEAVNGTSIDGYDSSSGDTKFIKKKENYSYQDTEFDNPFNTNPPETPGSFQSEDGLWHCPALNADTYTPLKLTAINDLSAEQYEFEFALPHPSDYTGCIPGQYVKVRVQTKEKYCERFFSPVSATSEFGKIVLMLKYETSGEMTKHFQKMEIGDVAEFRGPCGGFEYSPNSIEYLSLLSSGSGCAPFIQIMRDVIRNSSDRTQVSMLHYSESEDDIIYKDEMDEHAKDGRFNVFFSVGQVKHTEKWKGGVGYINSKVLAEHLPLPDIKSHKILICGGPSMVCSALQDLSDLGYRSENIFVYGQFGTEQVRAIYGRHRKLSSHKFH